VIAANNPFVFDRAEETMNFIQKYSCFNVKTTLKEVNFLTFRFFTCQYPHLNLLNESNFHHNRFGKIRLLSKYYLLLTEIIANLSDQIQPLSTQLPSHFHLKIKII